MPGKKGRLQPEKKPPVANGGAGAASSTPGDDAFEEIREEAISADAAQIKEFHIADPELQALLSPLSEKIAFLTTNPGLINERTMEQLARQLVIFLDRFTTGYDRLLASHADLDLRLEKLKKGTAPPSRTESAAASAGVSCDPGTSPYHLLTREELLSVLGTGHYRLLTREELLGVHGNLQRLNKCITTQLAGGGSIESDKSALDDYVFFGRTISALMQAYAFVVDENEPLKAWVAELSRSLGELKESASTVKADNAALQEEIRRLQDKLAIAERNYSQTHEGLKKAQTANQVLKSSMKEADKAHQAQLAALKAEKDALNNLFKARLGSLQPKLTALRLELNTMPAEIKRQRDAELAQIRASQTALLERVTAAIQRERSNAATLQEQLTQALSRAETAEEKLAGLEEENARLKQALTVTPWQQMLDAQRQMLDMQRAALDGQKEIAGEARAVHEIAARTLNDMGAMGGNVAAALSQRPVVPLVPVPVVSMPMGSPRAAQGTYTTYSL